MHTVLSTLVNTRLGGKFEVSVGDLAVLAQVEDKEHFVGPIQIDAFKAQLLKGV